MTLSRFPVEQFPGLNLQVDPTEAGFSGATDAVNISLDLNGRVRARDGYTLKGTTALTGTVAPGAGYYRTAANVEYIVVCDTAGTAYPINLSTGATGTTKASLVFQGSNNMFARFGTTSTQRLYVSGNTLWRFDGAWTAVAPPGLITTADLVAVTPTSNRLVIAARDASCEVQFSDASSPETWTNSNFVDLDPGDGERITGMAAWSDRLFVFKTRKFFVFYTESTDSLGQPIFNYRKVATGVGAGTPDGTLNAAPVVAGEQAVYFANPQGIWATTGEEPICLSRNLDPWILAGQFGYAPGGAGYGSLPAIDLSSTTLTFFQGFLYVNDQNNLLTLVYNTRTGDWSYWNIHATGILATPSDSQRTGLYHISATTGKKLAGMTDAVTTDNGTAITATYTTGLSNLGAPSEKVIRSALVEGVGTVSLSTAATGPRAAAPAAVSISPTLGPGAYAALPARGDQFSLTITGNPAWYVQRLNLLYSASGWPL